MGNYMRNECPHSTSGAVWWCVKDAPRRGAPTESKKLTFCKVNFASYLNKVLNIYLIEFCFRKQSRTMVPMGPSVGKQLNTKRQESKCLKFPLL